MRRYLVPWALLALVLMTSAGCAAAPPRGWQQGGTPLVVPRARWVAGDEAVDIDAHGHVLVDGVHTLSIDAAGRAFDPYNEPIAVLQRDGSLLGPNDEPMGWVGAGEAILPGGDGPWITLAPSGEVTRYDDDERRPFGVWMGCNQPQLLQACTLVTHLVGQQILQRRRGPHGVSVGFGVGVGVGVGP